jgi:hypothetical protein
VVSPVSVSHSNAFLPLQPVEEAHQRFVPVKPINRTPKTPAISKST